MNKKWTVLISLCFVFVIVFVSMAQQKRNVTIPDDVATLVQDYMNAYKNGTAESANYIYFEDEFKKSAYITAADKLLDYKLESAEKINDNLYALVVLVKTEHSTFYSGDVYDRVYNFAARIDDNWYYLNGVANIPADLQENLDKSKYTYSDENIVAPGDIVDAIEID